MRPRWETFEISESERFPELQGRRVDATRPRAGCSPLDVMCELALAEDLATRFRTYIANDDADAVGHLLTHDHVVLGLSDAGAHVDQLCDAPLPTDLLGNWVRDREVMPLERAVRKLTGEPADMFGFVRRGYLREGYCADVCVFDPATVGPGPTAAGARLPGRRRAPDGRGAQRRAPRAGQRHADPQDGVQLESTRGAARDAPRDRLTPCDSAHGPEERPHVLDEQLGLLHRGEVAAAGHLGPVRHVVPALDPRARAAQDLPGIARRRPWARRRTRAADARRCAASPSTAAPTTRSSASPSRA